MSKKKVTKPTSPKASTATPLAQEPVANPSAGLTSTEGQLTAPAITQAVIKAAPQVSVQEQIAREIYDILNRGDFCPGYVLVPAAKAASNPTVDSVMATINGSAVCKLKKGSEDLHVNKSNRHTRGLVKGEEAKSIEVLGFDARA